MSLKAFHIIFVTASALLAFGFGGWAVKGYMDTGRLMLLLAGAGSLLSGVALIVYGKYFLKKLKHISYL